MLGCRLAQCLEKARLRRHQALQRFDDDAGEVGGVFIDHLDGDVDIVERRNQHCVLDTFSNAGAIWHGVRKIDKTL